jgi:MoxR-like ATPase
MTSNGERDFPPAFLRRCLRLTVQPPDKEKLTKIIESHLGTQVLKQAGPLIETFLSRRDRGDLATDQLLNALYLLSRGVDMRDKEQLLDTVLKYLSGSDAL